MEVARIYSITDAPDIVYLFDEYRKYYKQESDVIGAEKYLSDRLKNNESIIFVAIGDKKTIGFTQLYPGFSSLGMKPLWTLNDLFVLESYRSIGVGKALLDAAYKLGKSLNWKGMILETAHYNPARRLYEREGWKVDNEFLHYGIIF